MSLLELVGVLLANTSAVEFMIVYICMYIYFDGLMQDRQTGVVSFLHY